MNFDTIDECDHSWIYNTQDGDCVEVLWCPHCNIRKVEKDTEIHYFYIVKKRTEKEDRIMDGINDYLNGINK